MGNVRGLVETGGFGGGAEGGFGAVEGGFAGAVGEHVLGEWEASGASEFAAEDFWEPCEFFDRNVGERDFPCFGHFFGHEGKREEFAVVGDFAAIGDGGVTFDPEFFVEWTENWMTEAGFVSDAAAVGTVLHVGEEFAFTGSSDGGAVGLGGAEAVFLVVANRVTEIIKDNPTHEASCDVLGDSIELGASTPESAGVEAECADDAVIFFCIANENARFGDFEAVG